MATAVPPPIPKKPRLMTHSERINRYGVPATISQSTGLLVPSAAWESRCLVRITVPWPDVTGYKMLRVHRDAAASFQRLFQAWADAGLLDRLITFDGGAVCRMIRGKEKSLDLKDLSAHAFGAAIDVNVKWNQLNTQGAPVGTKGSVRELIPIANALGFVNGGSFSRPDYQHFECGVDPALG